MTDATSAPPKPASPAREIWHQFRTHKGALFGLIVLGILITAVLIGPYLWVPEKLTVAQAIKLKNQGPSLRFPLGTDQLGRDMLALVLLAGRVSLAVGLVAMSIAIVFGTPVQGNVVCCHPRSGLAQRSHRSRHRHGRPRGGFYCSEQRTDHCIGINCSRN